MVQIGFRDAHRQRVFNDDSLLRAEYGSKVAKSIATRMCMLTAAPHLASVDPRPPIGLRRVDGRTAEFTINLVPPRRLRFVALNPFHAKDGSLDLRKVEAIEIIGVEG